MSGPHLQAAGGGTARRFLPLTLRRRLAQRWPRRTSGKVGDLAGVLLGPHGRFRSYGRLGACSRVGPRGFGPCGWLGSGGFRCIPPTARFALLGRRCRTAGQEPVQPSVDPGSVGRRPAVATPGRLGARGRVRPARCIRCPTGPPPLPGRNVGRVGDSLRTRSAGCRPARPGTTVGAGTGAVRASLSRARMPGLVRCAHLRLLTDHYWSRPNGLLADVGFDLVGAVTFLRVARNGYQCRARAQVHQPNALGLSPGLAHLASRRPDDTPT